MAQLWCVLGVLLVCVNYSFCVQIKLIAKESELYNETIQLVLHILRNDSDGFSSATISTLNASGDASPDENTVIQLDVHDTCYRNVSSVCEPLSAICELNIGPGSEEDIRARVDEGLKCAEKEPVPFLPAGDQGFVDVDDVEGEARDIAEYAIRQLEEGRAQRRSILDIMSLKKDSRDSGTRFFLTVKVTATDEGDASRLEVCELEVNQTSDVTLRSSGACFPPGDKRDRPLSEEHVLTEAGKVVAHLNRASPSGFLYGLLGVAKAEQTVTPGSEGLLSTYELRMAPSVCLKTGPEASEGEDRRECVASDPGTVVTCVVTSWQRPWLGDVLYSRSDCRVAGVDGETTEVDASPAEATTVREPVAEALLVRQQDEAPVPVVEEPVMARHVPCLGCAEDLSLHNPALAEFVEQALAHIDSHSKSAHVHAVARITRAQREVVNGIRYIIHMEVLETVCLKGSDTVGKLCEPKPDSDVQTCVVEFMEKPWLSSRKHIESNNCTEEVNDLDNEIIPEYISRDNAEKQEIIDYFDALDDTDYMKGFGDVNVRSQLQENSPPEPAGQTEPPASEHRLYLTNDDIDAASQSGTKPELTDTDVLGSTKKQPSAAVGSSAAKPDELSSESAESEELASSVAKYQNTERITGHDDSVTLSKDGRGEESDSGSVSNGVQDDKVQDSMDRDRRNAQTVGALKDFDKSDEDLVNELGQIAVATLDELDDDDNKRVVLEILDAKKQIVDGILYHLTIRVGYTQCKEDASSAPDCAKDDISSRICKVQLHRAFAGDEKPKVVQSECGGNVDDYPMASRARRSVVGGSQPASVSDPEIVRVASTALSHLSQSSTGLSNPPCIDTIRSASKQVVAGMLYKITIALRESTSGTQTASSSCPPDSSSDIRICELQIWEKPWMNFFQVTNASCNAESRTRREVLVGGRTPASVDDSTVLRLTNLALAHLAQTEGSPNKPVVHIEKAEKQVVAGIKWYITFTIGEQNVPSDRCDIQVLEQAWRNYTEILSSVCSPINASRTKRSDIGNSIPILLSPDSADVKEAAKFALAQLDHTTTSPNAQYLVQVKEAHTQVVDGDQFYFLLLEVGESTCPKNAKSIHSACQRLENVPTQHCHVDVLARETLGSKQLINSVCGPADTVSQHVKDALANSAQRFKRSPSLLVGAPFESRPDDDYIQELASFVTSELDRTSGSDYAMKTIRVVSAKTQIVSGKLVHLILEVGFSNCLKESNIVPDQCELRNISDIQVCHVNVWDQPWKKHREVKEASCDTQYSVHSVKKRSASSRKNLLGQFESFRLRFNKVYGSKAEYKRRYHIFKANMKKVELLQETERGTAKYGATQFADLTAKEFKANFLGLNSKKKHENLPTLPMASIPDVELPVDFDWRHYNAVTSVKNQGSCGSCWAFSVTGNVEGQWAIHRGKLLSLSEQELLDCDQMDDGCGGGEMVTAYKAVENLGGLETENEYPYEGERESCHFNNSEVRATITGAVNITKNETQMAQWLVKNGPISIGINANAMQFYFGGVSHPWKILCSPDDLDHGVLIVGFGVHKSKYRHKILPYWLVKNSWGPSWGEKGYYRVFRGDGTCGINQMATSAIVV
ncbi:uncharacterized protein LOC134537443 isoform X2 [Bacillus rossius redtenbacheri]|uniref:uncharacterized protein LOC134537443 isoform X2 n=1 Tax=Bacillus rossius redtenbacheri TaxID=93214 RepID=UPI002FDD7152